MIHVQSVEHTADCITESKGFLNKNFFSGEEESQMKPNIKREVFNP